MRQTRRVSETRQVLPPMSIEFLQRLPLFADLPEADLRALYQRAEPMTLPAGEWLMREGEMGDALYVVLEGGIEISKRSGEQEVTLAVRGPGEVIGEMALLDQTPRSASGRIVQDVSLLKISKEAFRQVLAASPTAALALLNTVNTRLRSTEAMLRQSEKMAALGTLAAGLAHELNNPAAALKRAAAQARALLPRWQQAHADLYEAGINEAELPELGRLAFTDLAGSGPPVDRLDPLARSDLEEALQAWLEQKGVEQAWELAPVLLDAGLTLAPIVAATAHLTPSAVAAALKWVSASRSLAAMLHELTISAERISEIVGAVRSYAYLDQAPVQQVDLHRGLDDTLLLLRSKLEPGITVHREYSKEVPPIEAYGSELNQVWTNLIANAAEALGGTGEIWVRTGVEGERVWVEICDNGPGMPAEIRERIFEPFFTTKPPGQGTGLGLHISYNIVALHHQGQITVASQAGETCFRVLLPTQVERGPA